jgi:hypothetical protein
MIKYNFVINEGKVIQYFLNILNEEEFLEKLWEWCYEDDLWDYLDETPEVLNDSEELENFLLDRFIPEYLFHHFEDDDLNCFAFTVTDEKLDVREYNEDKALTFVLNKIKEHYEI